MSNPFKIANTAFDLLEHCGFTQFELALDVLVEPTNNKGDTFLTVDVTCDTLTNNRYIVGGTGLQGSVGGTGGVWVYVIAGSVINNVCITGVARDSRRWESR